MRARSISTIRALATVLVLTVAAAPPASAEAAPPGVADPVAEQLDAMRREIDALRDENAEMRGEISELRAANEDDWLTEQRSEEIRSLVADVLADADTRSGFQDGLVAGWSDGYFLSSPDGRFRLDFDGQLQLRWLYNYFDSPDRHQQGFEVTRTKLTFSGHVFNPDITFLLRTDQTRNEQGLVQSLFFVRDVWIQYQLDNEWSVRLGQFKVPYSREELVSSQYQLAVERSLLNENMNLGRTQGIQLQYVGEKEKFWFVVSDGATDNLGGFMSVGSGDNPVSSSTSAIRPDVEYAFSARYERLLAGDWRQFADFTSPPGEEFGLLVGVGAHVQETESGSGISSNRDELRWTAAAFDLSAEWGGASAFLGFTFSYADNPNFGQNYIYGIVSQGSVYLTQKLEAFGRFEYGWWDANFNVSDLNALTVGMNYYIDGHDVKWTTDIGFGISVIQSFWDSDIAGYRTDTFTSSPQIVFRSQVQLLF